MSTRNNICFFKKNRLYKKIDDTTIEVGAGLDFESLLNYMKNNNYTGLENLAGIPGSVGGLVFMNGELTE